MTRPSLPILFAAICLALLPPSEALAWYPCNGPGPGEVLIGVDPGGNGIAPTPLCEYVGDSGDGGGSAGGSWVDQHAALVWGQDAKGIPTFSWYANAASRSEAERGALAQCQRAGNVNCVMATSATNAAIAVAVDKAGRMHADWGAKAGDAKRKALRYCRQQGGKGCKIEKVIESPAVWVGN